MLREGKMMRSAEYRAPFSRESIIVNTHPLRAVTESQPARLRALSATQTQSSCNQEHDAPDREHHRQHRPDPASGWRGRFTASPSRDIVKCKPRYSRALATTQIRIASLEIVLQCLRAFIVNADPDNQSLAVLPAGPRALSTTQIQISGHSCNLPDEQLSLNVVRVVRSCVSSAHLWRVTVCDAATSGDQSGKHKSPPRYSQSKSV